MKRKGNLYKNIYNFDNIYKLIMRYVLQMYVYSRIYEILKNPEYKVGTYNVFTIYEPKGRRIVSQNMQDKVVNHLVARYILYPALLPCLIDSNVASRKSMGTSKGLSYFKDFVSYKKGSSCYLKIVYKLNSLSNN